VRSVREGAELRPREATPRSDPQNYAPQRELVSYGPDLCGLSSTTPETGRKSGLREAPVASRGGNPPRIPGRLAIYSADNTLEGPEAGAAHRIASDWGPAGRVPCPYTPTSPPEFLEH